MKYATLHLSAILWLSLCALTQAKEVRLYTQRHYPADKEFFAQFTKDTGIEVKVIKAGANELLTRLESEKAAPQADLFITTDAGALDRADAAGLRGVVVDGDGWPSRRGGGRRRQDGRTREGQRRG